MYGTHRRVCVSFKTIEMPYKITQNIIFPLQMWSLGCHMHCKNIILGDNFGLKYNYGYVVKTFGEYVMQ